MGQRQALAPKAPMLFAEDDSGWEECGRQETPVGTGHLGKARESRPAEGVSWRVWENSGLGDGAPPRTLTVTRSVQETGSVLISYF